MILDPLRPNPSDFVPLKAVVMEILLAVADRPRHGYGILQEVREAAAGSIRLDTGPLYRHLRRLLEQGLVVEVDRPVEGEDDDERRRYYALAPLGREVMEFEGRRLSALLDRGRALGFLSS